MDTYERVIQGMEYLGISRAEAQRLITEYRAQKAAEKNQIKQEPKRIPIDYRDIFPK